MRVTFLGTGTSRGVPVIGCRCRVCTSADPRNHRLRTSLWIRSRISVVIDTSIDFRQQMLRYGVDRLDAVLFTHSHVDHILGLDDVYPFYARTRRPLRIYASPATMRELEITFRHLFQDHAWPGIPRLDPVLVRGEFRVGDLRFVPIEVRHGRMPVLGYRIGSLAYITDVNHIPEEGMRQLKGAEILILDGLRYKPHPTHFTLSEAAQVAQAVGAQRTFLVHMSHAVDHETANRSLPHGVELAHDGQVLEIEGQGR